MTAPVLCQGCGALGTETSPIDPATGAHPGCNPLQAEIDWWHAALASTTKTKGRRGPDQGARDRAARLIAAAHQIPPAALPEQYRPAPTRVEEP